MFVGASLLQSHPRLRRVEVGVPASEFVHRDACFVSPDVSPTFSTSIYEVTLEMEMRFLMPSLETAGTDLA